MASTRRSLQIRGLLAVALIAAIIGGQYAFGAAPTAAAATCEVTYNIPNQWPDGFLGDVTIRNNGAAVTSWTLAWTFGGNQRITNLWNGVVAQSGASVSVANAAWNGGVASGGTVNFGFQATFSGANAKPASFRLNGAACAVSP